MTIQSSGTLTINTLRSEFQVGSGNLGWFVANSTDPFIGTINTVNSNMRLSHYYNASRRTAKLTVGRSGTTDGFYRYGYSTTVGSDFYYPEAGSNTGAFGASTRAVGLSTTGTITGIHAAKYGKDDGWNITISTFSSNNSGWTTVYFKNQVGGTQALTRTSAADFNPSSVGNGIYNWTWHGFLGGDVYKIHEKFTTAYNSANTQPVWIKFD